MRLFEHIRNNEFKLKETSEEGTPITKIDKIQEQQSLQYINQFLVPEVVRLWNNHCDRIDRKPQNHVDVRTVLKNLKKVYHLRNRPFKTDAIFYQSYVKLPGNRHGHTFKFVTYRDYQNGDEIKNAYDYIGNGWYYTLDEPNGGKYLKANEM